MAKVSFSKAQSDLLASKFLDSIGADRDALPLDETMKALVYLAGTLINESANNLEKGGHVGSGALASSFKVLDPRTIGKDLVLDIEALAYYQFLNRGVKGTKKGSGEYSFKSSYPSQKMVDSIRKWMKSAGMTTRNVKKPVGKLEVKRKSIAQFDGAYAVARSIKQNGIKKTGFFDKAFQKTNNIANQELGKALKLDVINSLPSNINDAN